MKLLSIVGARPQFIKVAPFARAIADHNNKGGEPLEHLILHTGQHYDAGMSEIFFEELEIPRADFNLGVGSGRHGSQTGQMLEKIEQVLLETRPDMVVIYGDTNSTVAGALAAVKLHLPVAHVEAGLRSFNRRMPEEINRIVADHTSDILLAPTPTAMDNLAGEGLAQKAHWTGDIMYDAVLFNRQLASQQSEILPRLSLVPGAYGLVTVHRADNTDNDQRLINLLTVFNEIAEYLLPLVFPIHPRTANLLKEKFPAWVAHPRLRLIEPLGYLDMLCLLAQTGLVLTDSGGVQKEAFFLGRPCLTLREETEWPETVIGGGNQTVGTQPDVIRTAVTTWRRQSPMTKADFSIAVGNAFGDGNAAQHILTAIFQFRASQ